MSPQGNRQRRGAEVIREVVAEAVGRELSDPRLGFVTITDVRTSPDFAVATVYFTTLTRAQRDPSLRALQAARGLLQSRIGRAMRTRHTPHLEFVYDSLQDEAGRISRLIDEVAPADPPPPPPGDTGSPGPPGAGAPAGADGRDDT
jgi:ribosome-binding factor A